MITMNILTPLKILILLRKVGKPMFITQIEKGVDVTYANAYKSVKILKKSGIVTTSKKRRERYVSLTEFGKSLSLEDLWEE